MPPKPKRKQSSNYLNEDDIDTIYIRPFPKILKRKLKAWCLLKGKTLSQTIEELVANLISREEEIQSKFRDESDWWSNLKDKNPEHPNWSAFADWLHENEETGKAEAIRMIHKEKVKPKNYTYNYQLSSKGQAYSKESYTFWCRKPKGSDKTGKQCVINKEIFKHLKGWRDKSRDQPWCEYLSREEAYKDLINAYLIYKKENEND